MTARSLTSNPFTGEIGFVPLDVGNHSFNISVSDGLETVSEIVSLEVRNTNGPPEIEFIFPSTAVVGGNFSLLVNASDPDGDKLTFADDTELFDINITVTDGIETDYAVLNIIVICNQVILC